MRFSDMVRTVAQHYDIVFVKPLDGKDPSRYSITDYRNGTPYQINHWAGRDTSDTFYLEPLELALWLADKENDP